MKITGEFDKTSTSSATWLRQSVFPLWLDRGLDPVLGGFIENLSADGQPQTGATRRALVQARQIYSFRTGADMGVCRREDALQAVRSGTQFLLKHYSHANGGFVHAVDAQGRVVETKQELYTQAFVLFGLAQAYAMEPASELKERAKKLVEYLNRERRVASGGFTELSERGPVYQSNPHMHLFEAAIEWMEVDADPVWRRLADEILELALKKMIQPKNGLLAEHFNENWQPLLESSRFVFEPGHQFEWSWLMGRYQKLTGRDLRNVRQQLYLTTQSVRGIDPVLKTVYDQMWSDLTPKLRSSRFWPNCERIKAASQLALEAEPSATGPFVKAANEGLQVLFTYLQTKTPGLWYDACDENGKFKEGPAKASSLYHIIGAMSEHAKLTGKK